MDLLNGLLIAGRNRSHIINKEGYRPMYDYVQQDFLPETMVYLGVSKSQRPFLVGASHRTTVYKRKSEVYTNSQKRGCQH